MAQNEQAPPATGAPAGGAADAAPAPMEGGTGPAVFLGVLFVVTISLALAVAKTFEAEVGPVFEDPEDPTNPLIYLVLVVVFTLVILAIAKWGKRVFIQLIVLGAMLMTMVYVFWPLGRTYIGGSTAAWQAIAFVLASFITFLLWKHPEWWVIDTAGVVVGVGATALFGISFGILPAMLLLVAFAVYDFIAVYRTKHMIDLADAVMDLHLPVILVAPKVRGYSFIKEAGLKKKVDKKEPRDALFMGLGDIVIPGVLVVSAFRFLSDRIPLRSVEGIPAHLLVAVAALLGGLVGFYFLMRAVLKGRPHAGLPSLNGGTIAAFLLATAVVFGPSAVLGGCTGPDASATADGAGGIEVTWSKVEGATGYNVYRAGANDTTATLLHEADGAQTAYTDRDVTGGASYQYWVTARGGGVESGRCGVLQVQA